VRPSARVQNVEIKLECGQQQHDVVRTTHDTRCSVRWKRVPSPHTPPLKFKRDTSRVLKQPADSGDGVSDVEPRTAVREGFLSLETCHHHKLACHTQHPDQSHVWQQHALRCSERAKKKESTRYD
jgi:hypothetical protein